MNRNILFALLAAALFGASTPFAKLLVGELSPALLAGLLYLGSGVGLGLVRCARDRGWTPSGLRPPEWPWMLGAIGFGGVLGPVALMVGLTGAARRSMLARLHPHNSEGRLRAGWHAGTRDRQNFTCAAPAIQRACPPTDADAARRRRVRPVPALSLMAVPTWITRC